MVSNYKVLWLVWALLSVSGLAAMGQSAPQEKPLTPEEQLERLPHDTSRIRPLFFLANTYMYSDSAIALRYVREAVAISRKYGRERAECNFLALWGEIYTVQDDFPAAAEKLTQEKALAKRIHNVELIAEGEQITGVMYSEQGDFPAAITADIAYLAAGEELKDTVMIQVGYVNMANSYFGEKNYDKTLEYARRVFQFPYKDQPRRMFAVTKAFELIASVYLVNKQYGLALDSLQLALPLYKEQQDEAGVAATYTVMARCYPANALKELEYTLSAQQIWERAAPGNDYSVNNLANIGAIYAGLARVKSGAVRDTGVFVYVNGQETPASLALRQAAGLSAAALNAKSRSYYQLALDRAKTTTDRQDLMLIYDSLSNMEFSDGHYKEAYAHLQQYNHLNDSVFSQENKNKIAGVEADYKVALSDQQLQTNKLALSDQIKIKWLLIGSLVLALLITGLIFRQSRVRQKNNASLSALNGQLERANAQLDEANKVKTRFFGILNHDLRSPVANLITLLHLRQAEPEDMDEERAKAKTGEITVAAEELLDTMEELLIWSKGQMEQFKPSIRRIAVRELFEDMARKFGGPEGHGVSLRFEQPSGMTILTDEYFCKTMLRNLTGNAIKALDGRTDGTIHWRAWEEDGYAWLSISDNGPGATEAQLRPLFDENAPVGIRSGLGLHIVRDMARAIGCEVYVQPGYSPAQGLEVRLKIKQETIS